MAEPTIVCETSRLLLRHFTADDIDFLVALHSDPDVTQFIGGVKSPEQTRQRLEQWIHEYQVYGCSKWAVVLRSTGELVGRCGLAIEAVEGADYWELGWTFARAHWGNGYATEAAKAAMEHSFHALGHQRLISLIRPGNLPSVRVAKRLGMTYERRVLWNNSPADMYSASAQ